MPSAAARAVREGDTDLAVTFDYPSAGAVAGDGLELHPAARRPDGPRRRRRVTGSRPGVVSASPTSPASRGSSRTSGPTVRASRLIRRGCSAAGFEPEVAFRINDCKMTQAMVAAGEGIALQPRLMLRPPHPGVAIKALGAAVPIRRVVALRLASRFLTPPVERFLALLRVTARDCAEPI